MIDNPCMNQQDFFFSSVSCQVQILLSLKHFDWPVIKMFHWKYKTNLFNKKKNKEMFSLKQPFTAKNLFLI